MRLPLFWLTDYVDPGMEASKLASRLAMTGTEVDRVHTHGVTALENFVVGRQHPLFRRVGGLDHLGLKLFRNGVAASTEM